MLQWATLIKVIGSPSAKQTHFFFIIKTRDVFRLKIKTPGRGKEKHVEINKNNLKNKNPVQQVGSTLNSSVLSGEGMDVLYLFLLAQRLS